ncbi:hypothetical protein, conserved [Eimeria praecox]|uniref:Uncharacterized protein n=1 Tax=Eimeria praecox TaxID=51316 RepID=U6G1E4_9EIME|nr:hypothetical protein, conserved [Eimeria praecox]
MERGLASGQEPGVTQDGDGDLLGSCAFGQTSDDHRSMLDSHTAVLSQRASEEVLTLAQSMGHSASKQTAEAQVESKPALGRPGALEVERHSRKRKQAARVGLQGLVRASKKKKALLDEQQEKEGGRLGLPAQRFSLESQLNFWLSSAAEDASLENAPQNGVLTLAPASMSLPSGSTREALGRLEKVQRQTNTLLHPPLDIDLESLLDDDEKIVLGDWFPKPTTSNQPVSHFDPTLDLTDCEELKCYLLAGKEPAPSSAYAGIQQDNLQDTSFTGERAEPSNIMGQADQSESESSVGGEVFTAVASGETNRDLQGHPFYRLPAVSETLSDGHLEFTTVAPVDKIRRKPVFVLQTIRHILLRPSLSRLDLCILLASVERLRTFAVEAMDVSLSGRSPHSFVDVLGTVFLVVDSLYCALQLLGQSPDKHTLNSGVFFVFSLVTDLRLGTHQGTECCLEEQCCRTFMKLDV